MLLAWESYSTNRLEYYKMRWRHRRGGDVHAIAILLNFAIVNYCWRLSATQHHTLSHHVIMVSFCWGLPYIIANLGFSINFGGIEFMDIQLPATMLIDYIRVYQPTNAKNIGCNPPDYPMADYINKWGFTCQYYGSPCVLTHTEIDVGIWKHTRTSTLLLGHNSTRRIRRTD